MVKGSAVAAYRLPKVPSGRLVTDLKECNGIRALDWEADMPSIFQFHYDEVGDEQRALELMQQVADKFPQITSLMYVDNQKGNDTINDLELSLFKGNDHIYELMEDLKFKVCGERRCKDYPGLPGYGEDG